MEPRVPSDGGPPDETREMLPVLLGRYRIERPLGYGGMGEVSLATDTLLNRRVALKRLRANGQDQARRRASILKEARRASRIAHRSIAAIYDVLDLQDEVVIVMEFVDGVTLRARMAQGLTLEDFWRIAPQCTAAVGAAHAQGVIHRDIKPDNLMLTRDGELKVLDFGLAVRADRGDSTTTTVTDGRAGAVAGTPQYMSPESHLAGHVDERADIFALGVVFYEMLAGIEPFAGDTYAAVVHKVLVTHPEPVLELNPAAGAPLSDVVERMIAKDPADRYASMAEVDADLSTAKAACEGGAEPLPRGTPGRTPPPPLARTPARGATPRSRGPGSGAQTGEAPAAWPRPAVLALGAALLAIAAVGIEDVTSVALPRDRHLAVLVPLTPGADTAFASLALGWTDLLSARLQRSVVTPGFQLASFLDGRDEQVRTAADARAVLGATLALIPTLEQRTDGYRARLDLYETAHGERIATRTVDAPIAQPFAFLDRAGREAEDMLGLAPPAGGAAYGIRGAGTLRFYLEGLGRLRAAHTADDAERAAEVLELACRTEPEAGLPRATLAFAQLRVHTLGSRPGALGEAEASAREAVALDSMRAETHRSLGMVLAAEHDDRGSLAEYARACALDPTDDDSRLRLARAYGRLHEPEREEAVYREAIARRPHAWQPRWWLAIWLFRAGRVDDAIAAYGGMIERAPQLFKGYSGLGGVLVLRGDYVPAIGALRHSLALRPTKIAFDNLGTAYFNSGRFAEAVDAYNQSFQFGFANYASWLNLGDAYFFLRGRQDQAAEAYSQAVRLGREEIVARVQDGRSADLMIPANLATVFPKLGAPDSARIYLGRALAADSTNPMVGYCAAVTYWQLRDRSRAMAWLEKSVQGGYPVVWLHDSPVFREWHEEPRFAALLARPGGAIPSAASRN